jgi:hypothetical protein
VKWLIALRFILVHSLAGQEVEINPRQITHLSVARKHNVLTESGCVIYFTNGKFFATRETCNEVVRLLRGEQ